MMPSMGRQLQGFFILPAENITRPLFGRSQKGQYWCVFYLSVLEDLKSRPSYQCISQKTAICCMFGSNSSTHLMEFGAKCTENPVQTKRWIKPFTWASKGFIAPIFGRAEYSQRDGWSGLGGVSWISSCVSVFWYLFFTVFVTVPIVNGQLL